MTALASRPVAESLQATSPLETLVRRTSSRRKPSKPTESISIPAFPDTDQDNSPRSRIERPPSSPLLHTRFRTSTATHNTFNTSIDLLNRSYSRDYSQDLSLDDASVYSGDRLSQRGQSEYRAPSDILHEYRAPSVDDDVGNYPSGSRPRRSSDIDPFIFRDLAENKYRTLPQVIVSTEPQELDSAGSRHYESIAFTPTSASQRSLGRAPSLVSPATNYSRPNRPLIVGSEEEKRRVLERNQQRKSPSTQSPQTSQYSDRQATISAYSVASAPAPYIEAPPRPARSLSEVGPSRLAAAPSKPSPLSAYDPSYATAEVSTSALTSTPPASASQTVSFYSQPQGNASTPTSLYSAYSYYPYEDVVQSPVGDTLQVPGVPSPTFARSHSSPSLTIPGRSSPTSPLAPTSRAPSKPEPMTSDDYLQLGIQHHEADRLTESASCFEKSATLSETEQGASGVGMLMWGLALRHGWGCEKNEKRGFAWLRKAAEAAVGDLEKARMDAASSAIKGELVLAIYEVGQCFFQGWGVKKDQKMGVSYFQIAANLGDMDAQQELAFCLANGRGCKKDRKEAARWYREAVKQGASDVGLAWIYKEKFQ